MIQRCEPGASLMQLRMTSRTRRRSFEFEKAVGTSTPPPPSGGGGFAGVQTSQGASTKSQIFKKSRVTRHSEAAGFSCVALEREPTARLRHHFFTQTSPRSGQ